MHNWALAEHGLEHVSNIEGIVNSDQLTIQYQAYQNNMFTVSMSVIISYYYVTFKYLDS